MSNLVFGPGFRLDWDDHVFPVDKYDQVAEAFSNSGGWARSFISPESATDEQLLLVHTPEYLAKLQELTADPARGYDLFEVPCTQATIDAFRLACGATLQASRIALESGTAGVIGGGFHHAYADRGEGFCLLNDLAVAVRALQQEKTIESALIIDLDVHQGNGTAKIFEGDTQVYTFSMHQLDIYPLFKEMSSHDVALDAGTKDQEYLDVIWTLWHLMLDSFQPDLVLYQAGADPYEKDLLGSLGLTKEGLLQRDQYVIEKCRDRDIPVVATLGGGYAENIQDVVDIHVNTLRVISGE